MPEREIGTKSIGAMEFTDDEKGEVRAIVYTLGVVDRDREVLLPETFDGEVKVKLSEYGHSAILSHAKGSGNPVKAPVGKGTVRRNAKNELEFQGRYFMSTSRGRDAYFTAKEMGPEQEWSVTFWRDSGEPADKEWHAKGARRVWKSPIEPFEVSPVTVAGGVGTRTVGVKAADVAPGDDPEQTPEPPAENAEEQAAREQAEAEAEEKAGEEAAVEVARLEAEKKAAEEAESKELEAQRLAEQIALKARAEEVMSDFHRVQRTIQRMGLR